MKTSAGPPRNLPRFWTYTFNQVSPEEPQRTRGATHRRPRPQCRIEPSLADIDAADRYSLYHLPVPSLRSGLGDRATVRAAKNGEEAPRSAADLRVSGPRGLSSSGSAWGLSFLAQIEDTRAAELVLDRADALRAVIPWALRLTPCRKIVVAQHPHRRALRGGSGEMDGVGGARPDYLRGG
jgi:hypothetical protein